MGRIITRRVARAALAATGVVAVVLGALAAPAAAVSPAPAYDGDFPDPFVLEVDGTYYAYSTQQWLASVPVMSSTDLQRWELLGDALPSLPEWAEWGRTWAPSVLRRADGGSSST